MKSRRRSYLVELDISLWVIEKEKLVVEADSDSDIQKYKSNGSLWESEFSDIWVFERVFWTKMENDYNVRENENVRLWACLLNEFENYCLEFLEIPIDEKVCRNVCNIV